MKRRKRRRRRKNFLALFVAAFAIIIFCAGILSIKNYLESPVDKFDDSEIKIDITSGMSTVQAANLLKKSNLIKNKWYFIFYLNQNKLNSIKSGTYILSKSNTLFDIAKKINVGAPLGEKIVIPENFTIKDIADRLYKNGIIEDESSFAKITNEVSRFSSEFEFLNNDDTISLEGYLYPETYFFTDSISYDEIIKQMLNEFRIFLDKYDIMRRIPKGFSLNDVVILASIVQKEASSAEEMPEVASVFINRLEKNMPLQSCSTVEYAIGSKIRGKGRLSAKDIKINSPYNTYINKGLPPGAISCVSKEAVLAVIDHKKTDYLYFVADKNGKNIFAKTYQEHLENIKEIYGDY